MDSDDDDYRSISPSNHQPSPQIQYRRLKRLKKSEHPKPLPVDSIVDPILFPTVDFAKLEALENDSEFPYFNNESNSIEEDPVLSPEKEDSPSRELVDDGELGNVEEEKEAESYDEVKKTKRSLEFDDESIEPEKVVEVDEVLVEESETKKKKKKRVNKSDDESKAKVPARNKRSEEKERKAYLKELHAESQRLLRETSDASFKPIPVVKKPISSVLEKIRKRKLEILKKTTMVEEMSYSYEEASSMSDKMMDVDVSNEDRKEPFVEKTTEKEISAPSLDGVGGLEAPNAGECEDVVKQTSQLAMNEEPTPAFRAPVEDTQDLFDDSEPNVSTTAEQKDEQPSSPLEEEFAPSLLAMNLQFDSAPVDDSSSSDEEYNDKENVAPCAHGTADGSSSPTGDEMKLFVDDEAEEEDDSDNDLNRFQENEDEDNEEDEDLKNMIATGYKERPIDNERRNELHQKWLEQQDAAGTDNLMQRLKYGPVLRDTILADRDSESDEDDEESEDEAKEESVPRKSARENTKRAKQTILQMFSDKEEVYLSDEDEDTQRRHAHRLLIRKEEQVTVVSPADDESSKEVFGLIKKLNIVSDSKKKPKASSFFDSMLKGGNSNSSSKSSFLGRVTNNPMPSSNKKGSGTFRSFIFGRDDSNSRSSISVSEDSSETVSQETRSTRNVTAKFSSSQTKFSSQTRNAAGETSSKISLLDVLKRSSSQSRVCNQDSTVDLTKSIFAFKAPKKPMKIEGRS